MSASSSSGRRVVVLGLRRALQSRTGASHETSSWRGLQAETTEESSPVRRPSLSSIVSPRRRKKAASLDWKAELNGLSSPKGEKTSSRLQLEFEPPYRVIARGGFSKVIAARHRIDHKEYAIKVSEAGANEVRLLASLGSHDHIIRYFAAWYEESCPDSSSSEHSEDEADYHFAPSRRLYIQLELCGHTLRHWLNTNWSRSQNDIFNIANALISGLSHLHSFGFAHLDFASSNILQRFHGPWVISDFGLTRSNEEPFNAPSPQEGHKLYLSPERRAHNPQPYDLRKADIFSLGVILFELITLFRTEMERCLSLERLQICDFAHHSTTRLHADHKFDHTLSIMLSSPPDQRPEASTLLSKLFPNQQLSSLSIA